MVVKTEQFCVVNTVFCVVNYRDSIELLLRW